MYHFLYCFDNNYIKQAFTSVFSVLENVDKKITLHLISNLSEKNIKVPKKIQNHKYLDSLVFYEINLPTLNLYNLENAHVSEATFYRLFLQDYLEIEGFVTYLDCDVICLENPLNKIDDVINNLKRSDKIVSFNTEILRGDGYGYFEDLNLQGDSYFNAGVMVFDFGKWVDFKVKEKSLDLIPKIKDKALFWDQDILNIIFDSINLELPTELNSRTREESNNLVIFHHFSGKYKPWSINGIKQRFSNEFHDFFRTIYKEKYLINVSNFTNGKKHLNEKIKDREIRFDKQGFSLLYYSLKALIKTILK
tara:strand:+ start:22941 stop:23861 length:921 start_codon:yes stop_codon:yes gene_type:complete